eukprot:160112_1
MSDKTGNELAHDSGKYNQHQYYIYLNRAILFYTFVGVTYLLFIKSNPDFGCSVHSTKQLSLEDTLITSSPITAIPIPKRHLLQTPTAAPTRPSDASIKRNHDLILNLYDMLPNGIVIIWYGLIANIPQGWSLCDGSNGTPDLRDKFVIGGGNLYNLNDNGGSTTTTITSTNQLP